MTHFVWVKDVFVQPSNELQEKERMIREKIENPFLEQQGEREGFMIYFTGELVERLKSL